MNNLEESYDFIPALIKEHAGLPDLYKDLRAMKPRLR